MIYDNYLRSSGCYLLQNVQDHELIRVNSTKITELFITQEYLSYVTADSKTTEVFLFPTVM